jgi:DNA-binding response OmpR family regulator
MINGHRRRVLVVDDDALVRRVVRTVLEVNDCTVIEAENGELGLQMIASEHPPVVVLDMMMPGLDGLEVCRRIDHDSCKVLMLTARTDVEDESLAAGAVACITKPFSSTDLLDRIEALLA